MLTNEISVLRHRRCQSRDDLQLRIHHHGHPFPSTNSTSRVTRSSRSSSRKAKKTKTQHICFQLTDGKETNLHKKCAQWNVYFFDQLDKLVRLFSSRWMAIDRSRSSRKLSGTRRMQCRRAACGSSFFVITPKDSTMTSTW